MKTNRRVGRGDMEFRRKKRRGQNQKVRRTWLSNDHYRIVWRREVCGVRVPARFQATVRTVIPNYGGVEGESFEMWDFTDPVHRLFKARGKAEESCERHRRLWSKACEATGIRQLTELFGKLPLGIPVWARKKLNPKVCAILTRPRTAKQCEEDEPCPESVSASSDAPSAVPPAEPAATGRRKRAVKRTGQPPRSTGKRERNTTGSPGSGAKRSRGPRKTKSKPSGSLGYE